jgi:MioC protein
MAKVAVIVGTVYGAAQYVAEQAITTLSERDYQCQLFEDASLKDVLAFAADIWLVISSTTGEGDIPDNVLPFYLQVKEQFPLLTDKRYAVIALGDSSYENFCGAGEQFNELLAELQGTEVAPMLRIDAIETLDPEVVALPWLTEHFTG